MTNRVWINTKTGQIKPWCDLNDIPSDFMTKTEWNLIQYTTEVGDFSFTEGQRLVKSLHICPNPS